ncbi:MAG: hypothetical protein ACLPX5_08335 [Dissulfurispiraceae bacterium]
MEMLKTFEEKITYAVEKVKALKEEKIALEKRVSDLEKKIVLKDQELERQTIEKASIKKQIEELLTELDTLELK